MERKFDFPIRNSSGALLTVSLFRETSNTPDTAVFTLGPDGTEAQPSLYLIYREYEDPTEYQFAMDIFGEYRAWKHISQNPRISVWVESWRDELEAKLRSRGIIQLREQAENGSSTAARWISEAGWRPKRTGPKSKAQTQKEERVQTGIEEHLKEHYERLRSVPK